MPVPGMVAPFQGWAMTCRTTPGIGQSLIEVGWFSVEQFARSSDCLSGVAAVAFKRVNLDASRPSALPTAGCRAVVTSSSGNGNQLLYFAY